MGPLVPYSVKSSVVDSFVENDLAKIQLGIAIESPNIRPIDFIPDPESDVFWWRQRRW